MGFRSTVMSEDYVIEWPKWFKKKYDYLVPTEGMLLLDHEIKPYLAEEFGEDVQKALLETRPELLEGDGYTMIWLHECGGITKVQVMTDRILSGYPVGWKVEEGYFPQSRHSYCYGCSDLAKSEVPDEV